MRKSPKNAGPTTLTLPGHGTLEVYRSMGDLAFVPTTGEATRFPGHPLSAAAAIESMLSPDGSKLLLGSNTLDTVWLFDAPSRTIQVALELPRGPDPFRAMDGFERDGDGVVVKFPGGSSRYAWPREG